MVCAQRIRTLSHLQGKLLHRLPRAITPEAAQNQIDANDIIRIITSADLVTVGPRDHVDARLKTAVIAQSDGHRRLKIDRAGAVLFCETGQWRIREKALGDDFVVVAAEFKIEAEQD